MPVYVYKCEQCGQVFEKQASFKASLHGVTCPSGHTQIHRVYTAPTIIFKGNGFYVNDSRTHTSK